MVFLEFFQLLREGVNFFAEFVLLFVEKPVFILLVELVLLFGFFHAGQERVVLECDFLSFGLGSGIFFVKFLKLFLEGGFPEVDAFLGGGELDLEVGDFFLEFFGLGLGVFEFFVFFLEVEFGLISESFSVGEFEFESFEFVFEFLDSDVVIPVFFFDVAVLFLLLFQFNEEGFVFVLDFDQLFPLVFLLQGLELPLEFSNLLQVLGLFPKLELGALLLLVLVLPRNIPHVGTVVHGVETSSVPVAWFLHVTLRHSVLLSTLVAITMHWLVRLHIVIVNWTCICSHPAARCLCTSVIVVIVQVQCV